MYKIGLTGGIGSGKSRVADLLMSWGVPVVDTDLIAHGLTAAGGAAMPAIRAVFGPQAVAPSGAMDRAWMRAHVFAHPDARARLEAILHPMIGQAAAEQAALAESGAAQAESGAAQAEAGVAQADSGAAHTDAEPPVATGTAAAQGGRARSAYLVYVVPLLVESGRWADRVDRVAVVDCEPDVQVARVQSRSGLTVETIRRIMATQASRQERLAAAHDVIANGAGVSTAQLEASVLACHEKWTALAQASHPPAG